MLAYKAVKRTAHPAVFRSKMSHVPPYYIGETYEVPGPAVLCRNGFHACETVLQCFVNSDGKGNAYGYSIGMDPVLQVEISGDVAVGTGKISGTIMRVLRVLTWHERQEELHKPQVLTGRNTIWRLFRGRFHSEDEDDDATPAVWELDTGKRMWMKDGVLHRKGDAPAVVYGNGDREYYCNGKLHRDGDAPAVVYANGDQIWYRHGMLDRDNDKPAVVYANGGAIWYKRNVLQKVLLANGESVVYGDGVSAPGPVLALAPVPVPKSSTCCCW